MVTKNREFHNFLKKLCAGQNSIKGNFHLNIHQKLNGAAHRHEYPHYVAT